MGNLGRPKKTSGHKRSVGKLKRRSSGGQKLTHFPDVFRPESKRTKGMMGSWLNNSFELGNRDAYKERSTPSEVVTDANSAMLSVANTICNNKNSSVEITAPEAGYPFWSASISIVINGITYEQEIDGIDINEMIMKSLGWMNHKGM